MHKLAIACLSFSQKWGVKCKNVVNVRKSKFIYPPFFCTLFVLTFRLRKQKSMSKHLNALVVNYFSYTLMFKLIMVYKLNQSHSAIPTIYSTPILNISNGESDNTKKTYFFELIYIYILKGRLAIYKLVNQLILS